MPNVVADQRIVVVSDCADTLDSVKAYLQRFGPEPHGVSTLADAPSLSREADAVFFFADDFERLEALAMVSRLTVKRVVVITREVELFGAERKRAGLAAEKVVILRRPAWGWMLLDALRPHQDHV